MRNGPDGAVVVSDGRGYYEQPTLCTPLHPFVAIETGLARVRQAVKDVVTDMPACKVEGNLLDMLRALDSAKTWLDFAVRAAARDAERS